MLSPMKISSLQIIDEDGTNSSISSPGLFWLVVSGIVAKIENTQVVTFGGIDNPFLS